MIVAEEEMLAYETSPIDIMHYSIEKYDNEICNSIPTICTLKYCLPKLF